MLSRIHALRGVGGIDILFVYASLVAIRRRVRPSRRLWGQMTRRKRSSAIRRGPARLPTNIESNWCWVEMAFDNVVNNLSDNLSPSAAGALSPACPVLQPAAARETIGDYLVVMANKGGYWNASEWVPDYRDAIHFAAGLGYKDCETEARRVAQESGVSCSPTYIPAHNPPRSRKSASCKSRRLLTGPIGGFGLNTRT